MSTYYSGMDGSMQYLGATLDKVRDWQINLQTDALETTTLSQWDREATTGLRSATGSCTVLYYADAPSGLIQQVLQKEAQINPTCRLKLSYGNKYFEFDAVVTSAATGATVGEVMSVNVQFQKSGPFVATAV